MVHQYFLQRDPDGAVTRRIAREGAAAVAPPVGFVEVTEAEFSAAAIAPAGRRTLSKFAFLRLLTPTEYAAMFVQADPVLAYGIACFHAAADPFAIDDPLVQQMLDYCVQTGALTQARRDALWAAMEGAAS